MDFRFDDTTILECSNNANEDVNSYVILSKAEAAAEEEIIKIIDESGNEVNCTYEKFLEILEEEGLEGFII